MTLDVIHLMATGCVAFSVISAIAALRSPGASFKPMWRYQLRWDTEIKRSHLGSGFHYVPHIQAVFCLIGLAAWRLTDNPWFGGVVMLAVAVPPWLLARQERLRQQRIEDELDSFLLSLADALTAVPNLGEAIQSLHEHLNPPIKDEVGILLGEVRLGATIDDALRRMASRISLPGLDAAVEAALLSHRIGGDLSHTLRRIASSIREMARLEGVVKTKTAEGRTQAWVMGAVPPGMVVLLNYMDPEWIAPLLNDPIGWIILGVAAAFEVAAVFLIRRIMAVEI